MPQLRGLRSPPPHASLLTPPPRQRKHPQQAQQAAARSFDVVVFGAGGFTGRLVCEHLARDYGANRGVRWAMAGRDRSKLEAVRAKLADEVGDAAVKAVPLIVADAFDGAALADMARQAAVVVNVAGPYAKYGDGVVKAALEGGAHYCDITGAHAL